MRRYRDGYGSLNGTSDHYNITRKDQMRAQTLKNRKSNTRPGTTELDIAIGNANKMSKVITDPGKLIARMEAVYNVWGPGPVLQPFIDRIISLEPDHKKYVAAWRIGLADGRLSADPTLANDDDGESIAHIMAALGIIPEEKGFRGNSAERIIYQVAYDKAMTEQMATV